MSYLPRTSHITLLATLRRERMLPVAGELLVAANQRVNATDIVARAVIADEHRILNVTRDLGVPASQTASFMVKQDGDPVKKGEAIAVRKTLFGLSSRASRSSVDGVLLVSGEGKALLAALSQPLELRAGLPGLVTKVVPSYGLTIETTGALLEGVWGNGQDEFGVLRVLGSDRGEILLLDQLEAGLQGHILAVGALLSADVLKPLVDLGVRGLIVGSARADLLPALESYRLPVLIVEGFGAHGLSAPAYNLLASNSGREIWLNARVWKRYQTGRPEAILPLPSPGQAPLIPADGQALTEGKRVRILRGPERGQTGRLRALNERTTVLPSGVRTRTAIVELESAKDQPVSVALANLEILE